MAAKILVINEKGGVGKSTLSAHLSQQWCDDGYKVAVIDRDQQESLSKWHKGRMTPRVGDWSDADLIVIDMPPSVSDETPAAIAAADVVIIPMGPSTLDADSTANMLAIVKAVKAEKKSLLVLNKVIATTRMGKRIQSLDVDISVAKTTVGLRSDFVEAMAVHQTASEFNRRGKAAAEIKALANEIIETFFNKGE